MINRGRRRFRILVALIALYAVVGFLVLPPIVKSQLEQRASAALGRKVDVGRVRLNPFTLSVTLEQVDVRTPAGDASFIGWDRLYVNFDAIASFSSDWVVSDIALEGFHAAVAINEDGSLNFADVLEKLKAPATAAESKPGRPLRIQRLSITQARMDFSDHARREPFHSVVGPVNFTLLGFRTIGSHGAPYRFEASTESGEKLTWIGTISATPLASAGELRIENVHLPKYAPYFQDRLNGKLTSGDLSVSGTYDVNFSREDRHMTLKEGAVQLQKLRILDRADQPVVELAGLEVAGLVGDALALRAGVDSVHLNGGHVVVERAKNGSLNLLALLALPQASGAAATPAAVGGPARAIDVKAKEISLRDFDVVVRDLVPPRPAEVRLANIAATVKDFSLVPGATMPVDFTCELQPQGAVHVSGNVVLQPIHAEVAVDVGAVTLEPFSPYLEQFVNARITKGVATMKGHATVTVTDDLPINATFAGDGRVEDLALVDGVRIQDFAGFTEFAMSDLKIATAPRLTASLRELKLGGPYARIVMDEEQKLNLNSVLAPLAAPAPEAAKVTAPPAVHPVEPPDLAIARVVIDGGDFSFTDRSVQPQVQMTLKPVAGTLSNLSSAHPDQGDVALHVAVNGAGPIEVTGHFNPLAVNPFADLKVEGKSIDLRPTSPYVGKYAGYELERGHLFVIVQAKLTNQKLDMHNVVTLDQFTLGAPTHSPDATKLPVRLGIALLKDSEGKIVLDIPVQGSLADPSFSVGPVVGRVVTGLLAKAATSPFALLGSMFGGGGEELGEQEFVPGEASPTPESQKRLATVERALAARPQLNLEIEGSFDPAADVYALKRKKLDELVARQIADERRARQPNAPAPENVAVTDEERTAALQLMFAEKFGGQTKFETPVAPPPEVKEGPTPREHRGFFRKTLDVVTLKGVRERHAARKAEAKAEQRALTAAAPVAAPERPTVPVEEMVGRLAETLTITPDELRDLADRRAQNVRDRLMAEGKIASQRLVLTKATTEAGRGPRAELHLQ